MDMKKRKNNLANSWKTKEKHYILNILSLLPLYCTHLWYEIDWIFESMQRTLSSSRNKNKNEKIILCKNFTCIREFSNCRLIRIVAK